MYADSGGRAGEEGKYKYPERQSRNIRDVRYAPRARQNNVQLFEFSDPIGLRGFQTVVNALLSDVYTERGVKEINKENPSSMR